MLHLRSHLTMGVGAGLLMAAGLHMLGQADGDSAVAIVASSIGSIMPDRLEIARWREEGWLFNKRKVRKSWIPHRTFTHWPVFWIVVSMVGVSIFSDVKLQVAIISLSLGALVHIFGDAMTPMGVPLLNPLGRKYSLRWVRSVVSEWLIAWGFFLSSVAVYIGVVR